MIVGYPKWPRTWTQLERKVYLKDILITSTSDFFYVVAPENISVQFLLFTCLDNIRNQWVLHEVYSWIPWGFWDYDFIFFFTLSMIYRQCLEMSTNYAEDLNPSQVGLYPESSVSNSDSVKLYVKEQESIKLIPSTSYIKCILFWGLRKR